MQALPIAATPLGAPPVDAAGTDARSPEEIATAQAAFRASLAAAVQASTTSGSRGTASATPGTAPVSLGPLEPVSDATDERAEDAPVPPGVAEAWALLIAAWPGPAALAAVSASESAGTATETPSDAMNVAPLATASAGTQGAWDAVAPASGDDSRASADWTPAGSSPSRPGTTAQPAATMTTVTSSQTDAQAGAEAGDGTTPSLVAATGSGSATPATVPATPGAPSQTAASATARGSSGQQANQAGGQGAVVAPSAQTAGRASASRGQQAVAPNREVDVAPANAPQQSRGAAASTASNANVRLLDAGERAAANGADGATPAWIGANVASEQEQMESVGAAAAPTGASRTARPTSPALGTTAGTDFAAPTNATSAATAGLTTGAGADLAAGLGELAAPDTTRATAPAAAVAQVAGAPTDASQPLLNRLVASVRTASEQPGQPVPLTLDAGEPGGATVAVAAGDAGMSVHVATDSEADRARVAAVWPRLADALQQDGLPVERLVLGSAAPALTDTAASPSGPSLGSLAGLARPAQGGEMPARPIAVSPVLSEGAESLTSQDGAPHWDAAGVADGASTVQGAGEPRERSGGAADDGHRGTWAGADGEPAPAARAEVSTTPAAWAPGAPVTASADAAARTDGPTLASRPGTPLLDQLADGIRFAGDQAGQSVQLVLQPEGLGNVSVRVAVGEGGVSVHLAVSNAAAHDLIQSSWPQLSQALQQQGLPIDQLALALGQGPVGGGHDRQPAQQQAAPTPTPTASHRRLAERAAADEGAVRSASQVDYRV